MVRIAGNLSILVSTLLLATVNVGSVWARDAESGVGMTVRDVVNHRLFARDLVYRYRGLTSREEIEDIFQRDLDMDLEDFLGSRDDLEQVYARHPDRFANFFECVGDFVKRAAHGYWQHTILNAQALVGKNLRRWEHELDFLPRSIDEDEDSLLGRELDEDDYEELVSREPSQPALQQSWFARALTRYRDSMLEAERRYSEDSLEDLD